MSEAAESHREPPEAEPRYVDNPGSVLDAVRQAGQAHGLSHETNPLYAHVLNLAHRLDSPFLEDKNVSSLSNEFRQIVKALGLDKAGTKRTGLPNNMLTDIQSKIQRPTRPA